MSDDPHTSENTSLCHPVERPGGEPEGSREGGEVDDGEVEEEGSDGEVMHDIRERLECRALEAMGRDGFLELAQRERRLIGGDALQGIDSASGRRCSLMRSLLLRRHPPAGAH